MSEKQRMIVQDENLLGYTIPGRPDIVGILATSVIKGSIYSWIDGTAVNHPHRQRPATLRDFKEFRVCSDGFETDENFEPILP